MCPDNYTTNSLCWNYRSRRARFVLASKAKVKWDPQTERLFFQVFWRKFGCFSVDSMKDEKKSCAHTGMRLELLIKCLANCCFIKKTRRDASSTSGTTPSLLPTHTNEQNGETQRVEALTCAGSVGNQYFQPTFCFIVRSLTLTRSLFDFQLMEHFSAGVLFPKTMNSAHHFETISSEWKWCGWINYSSLIVLTKLNMFGVLASSFCFLKKDCVDLAQTCHPQEMPLEKNCINKFRTTPLGPIFFCGVHWPSRAACLCHHAAVLVIIVVVVIVIIDMISCTPCPHDWWSW